MVYRGGFGPYTGQLVGFGKAKDPKTMSPPLLSSEAQGERRRE